MGVWSGTIHYITMNLFILLTIIQWTYRGKDIELFTLHCLSSNRCKSSLRFQTYSFWTNTERSDIQVFNSNKLFTILQIVCLFVCDVITLEPLLRYWWNFVVSFKKLRKILVCDRREIKKKILHFSKVTWFLHFLIFIILNLLEFILISDSDHNCG